MKAKKPLLKELFSFSNSQKRGIFILLSIIVLLIGANIIISHTKAIDNTISQEIDTQSITPQREFVNKGQDTLSLFKFNPNTLTTTQALQLGLKENQIKNIQNYLNKGGQFFGKEDFKKLYTITNEEYVLLEPYICIPPLNIELNSADTIELKKLKGIGSVYANRIIKYRNLIGGYYSKEQLLEVYGITSEVFKLIEEHVGVDKQVIKKININSVEGIKQLQKHPYLNANQVQNIIEYKTNNDNFKMVEDLLKLNLLSESVFDKIKPYLITQ